MKEGRRTAGIGNKNLKGKEKRRREKDIKEWKRNKWPKIRILKTGNEEEMN